MDKAFGWIGEIFQTLLRLLPWLVIVPATHGGVAFVHGNRVKEWKAGLALVLAGGDQSYKLMAIVRQTQRIQSKVIMTKDMKTVTVGALVTYYVDDVVSAVAKIADLPSDIMERSQGAIFAEISSRTLEDIQANRVAFNDGPDRKVGGSAQWLWRADPAGAADRVRALPRHRHQRARGGRKLLAVDGILERALCLRRCD